MTTHTEPLTFPTHLEVGFWRLWTAAGIDPGATLAQALETMLVWADEDAEHEYGALACRQIRNALRDGREVVFRLEPTPGRHGTWWMQCWTQAEIAKDVEMAAGPVNEELAERSEIEAIRKANKLPDDRPRPQTDSAPTRRHDDEVMTDAQTVPATRAHHRRVEP